MAGLPKKYAKMGFKKGWAEFKKTKSGKKSSKKTIKVHIMAKKKTRKYSKKATPKTMMEKVAMKAITKLLPVGWGYVREPVNNFIAKSALGQLLPNFGRFGDEGSILALNYGATALGARGNKYSRKALQVIETAELTSVGREFYTIRQEKKSGGNVENFDF